MHFKLYILFFTLYFAINTASHAAIDELYNLSIGANLTTFDSSFSINSRDHSEVELEDMLGFDKQVNASWISAWYRVGDLHRIRMTYTPIRRSSTIESESDIVIDGTTIQAGATIKSQATSDMLDFSYIYSFYKTPQLEAGFSAGIYWLLNNTQVLASGQIIPEGDTTPTFQSDYATEQRIQAPMPLIGTSINYEFSPSWRTHASLRYLSLQLGNTEGSIFSAEAGTEYFFNNNWGIGASLSSFSLDVDVTGLVSSSTLGWAHNGIQVYAVFKY